MKKRWVVPVLWLGVLLLSIYGRAQNQILVIEGGTLIDGTGAAPLRNAVIVMEGSRIKAVGPKGKVSYPKNAKVMNEEGKTLLPGLIDSHIHFEDWMPPLLLHFGITTVYDTANFTEWILAQREALKHGKIKGPRMFVTGVIIDGPPERSDMQHAAERAGFRMHVNATGEAKALVDKLVAQGVDAIKIHEGLRTELLKAVVDEAHKSGLEVVGHSWNARDAAMVGLKFIEHTTPIARATIRDPAKLKEAEEKKSYAIEYMMDPQLFGSLIQLFMKNGVFINPTLLLWRSSNPRAKEWESYAAEILKDPSMEFVPEAVRQAWLRPSGPEVSDPNGRKPDPQGFKQVQEFVREFAAAGGKTVAGSDSSINTFPGLALNNEMQSLVDAGYTPMQGILSATRWAAELLHKEKDLGTVEVGKIADVIAVDGDPLADITAARHVRLVVMNGQVIDSALDPAFKNPMPRPVSMDRGPANGPNIVSISPKIAREGDREVTLQILGRKFTPQSVVRYDTSDLKTQFGDESTLTATISSASLQKVGTYPISVVNPGPGGATSNVAYFVVNFKY